MPPRKQAVKAPPKKDTSNTDIVLRAAGGIQTIRESWLARLLAILPWVVLIGALLVLFPDNPTGAPGPQIFGTGLIAVAVALFAFQTLLDLVPKTLQALWHRELVAVKPNQKKKDGSKAGELRDAYLGYIKEFEELLNNRKWQWGMVIAFELLTNVWLGFLNSRVLMLLFQGKVSLLGYLELGINIALAALIAPMAWRLIIIGFQIWRLPLKFDLNIQFEHPDHCGGLEPVGNLCLWNILIICLPLVHIGGWLLLARSDTSEFSVYGTAWWQSVLLQAEMYADVFTKLLWVLVPFSIIGFLLPLWSTHRVMEDKRRDTLIRLDGHIKNITDEWNAALTRIGNLTVAEGNEKLGQLEFAQQIYQRQKNVPVWPINTNIFFKFASTQIIPVLSLTGLGPGLVKTLSFVLDVISIAH